MSGPLVLVVEDNPITRKLYRLTLESAGYAVRVAADGQAALAAAAAELPDLVLQDMLLPDIDGLALAEQLHALPGREALRIVAVSGFAGRIAGESGDAPFVQRLLKPVAPGRLLAAVEAQLGPAPGRGAGGDDSEPDAALLARCLADRTMLEAIVTQDETIARLARVAEFRDRGTARHTERMSHMCALLARRSGLDAPRCELIRVASMMHDIGKIATPDRILFKPGPLTDEEFAEMRLHTEIGHRILAGSGAELLDVAAEIAWTHHERVDGAGYPRGLAGEVIPVEGRMAAVADVFDALTSERVYRPAFTVQEAVAIMRDDRGRHFDPLLLDRFLDALDEVEEIRARYRDAENGAGGRGGRAGTVAPRSERA